MPSHINEIVNLPKIVVPKAKRNIFINNEHFYLNIPELTFFYDRGLMFYVWIVKNNKLYRVPLPNIDNHGYVCLGENVPEKIPNLYVNAFFDTQFLCIPAMGFSSFSNYYTSAEYIAKYNAECMQTPNLHHILYQKTMYHTQPILNQKTLQFYLDNLIEAKYD